MSLGRVLVWLGVGGGLAFGLVAFFAEPSDVNIVKAENKNQIAVTIIANDATSASFRVSRAGSAPTNLTVVIPVGTRIYNDRRGSQLVITAKPAVISFSASNSLVTQSVEIYCVNQFRRPPTTATRLSLTPSSENTGYTEETEPVRKLANCMSNAPQSQSARQLALWLVSENLLDKSYGTVREQFRTSYRRVIAEELAEKSNQAREAVRAALPDISHSEIEAALAEYRQTEQAEDIEAEVERRLKSVLDGYATAAAEVLKMCDRSAADSQFLRTALNAR